MKAEMVGETPYKKFMFDTDFDELAERREKARAKAAAEAAKREAGEPEPEPEPEPEAPTYSEEDLTRAREEGLAEGRRLGTEEASSTVDKHIADTLNSIMQQTRSLFEAQAEENQNLTHHAVSVASALVRKLFPTLNQQTAQDQVQSMLEAALGQLSGEPEIIVRVPADLAENLHGRVESISEMSGFRGNIKILGDPALTIGDCRLEWSSGGVKRSAKDLARELDDIVARNLKTPAQPATDPEPAADAAAEPEAAQTVEAATDIAPDHAEEVAVDAGTGGDQTIEPTAETPDTAPDEAPEMAAAVDEPSPPLPDASETVEPHPATNPDAGAVADGPPPVPSEEIMAETGAAASALPAHEEDTPAPVPSEDPVADPAPEDAQDDMPQPLEEAAPEPERYGGADLNLEDDLKD
ncbi:MAG: FliH/SctL family protein [Rhodospirillales bacterium]